MKITVGELIVMLTKYDKDLFVQLDFDTSNLNIRNRDYNDEVNQEEIGTIDLPTEYEYRKKNDNRTKRL